MLTTDPKRIERLVALCKLWATIKYFHPYLAYRHDIDWDAALMAAIPEVNTADTTNRYVAAIESLLAALGDPATRVIRHEPVDAGSSSRERHPTYKFTEDGILVVKINHYPDLVDFPGTIKKLAAIKQEIQKARGILFDLRAKTPLSQERGYLSFAFGQSEIASVLSSTPFTTHGARSRMHVGFAPQQGVTSSTYTSGFKITHGRKILPALEAREIPTVFLLNIGSELPPEALGLQIAGKAAIIAEGDISDAPLIRPYQLSLGDEITVEIRLGEIVNEDGSSGLHPDVIVALPQSLKNKDDALATALAFLKDFKLGKKAPTLMPFHAIQMTDNPYPEMTLPPMEYRLLAAFRIWAVIHHFFPYKELIEEDWDEVLRNFILKMEQADSTLHYHLAVAEMVTHIHDSHGYVDSPVLKEHFGPACPPIRLQMVENVPVITTLLDEEVARTAGANIGDVVLTIDGEDALECITRRTKYLAASTPHRLLYQAALASLSGPEGSTAILTVRDRNDQVKEIKLPRKIGAFMGAPARSGEAIRLLSDDIGYADLDRLEVPLVDEMFERFKNTKAIIFDMRGYPKGTAWAIAPRLTDENRVKAALIQCPVVMGPNGESQSMIHSFVQSIPLTDKWRYRGKTVMLIDERALSQAEHTGLFFEAANQTKFVGSNTAGANGDVTNFNIPGGINIWFTGKSIKHIDGRQLQRIGLVPDIEVRPTIRGIQNGKDEVLESAVEYLRREFEAPQ